MSTVNPAGISTEAVSAPAELEEIAQCIWSNQASLIDKAAAHFHLSPSLVALITLPVLFQALAEKHYNKEKLRRIVIEAFDKGFDDWLRNEPIQGGIQ